MILRAIRFVPALSLIQDDRLYLEDIGVLSFIFGCFWLDAFPASELRGSARMVAAGTLDDITDRLIDTGYLERLENENL